MRLLVIVSGMMLLFSGCLEMRSQVPKPATYPISFQQKMQAAAHWEILARDVADQVIQFLEHQDTNLFSGYGIYVEPQLGVFGRAFTHMLTEHLVDAGIRVVRKRESCPVLRVETQLIKHKTARFDRPFPGAFTALAGGLFVLRHISWSTLAALSVPGAAVIGDYGIGYRATLPHHEVLITTSMTDIDDRYLLYNADLYYVNDPDWWHYPNEDIPEPGDVLAEEPGIPLKAFKVTGW
ncbi:MAG: hypothetical protein B6245_16670 [Desulfobacteraceae bacterium 4572_88]|nr:MAG: hypothetical protein B6245_16670 [Desulfobacteraceae bacterium 4572_88]